MEGLSRDEFLAHMEPLRARIEEIVDLQRAANGRTGKCETRIAVLEERAPSDLVSRVKVLEDRSPGRSGGLWGSIVALVMLGAAKAFESLWK